MIGRYAVFAALASGGMATVHLGRRLGPVGVGRTVAIKRLHPQFSLDPDFLAMFLDEARIVTRIRHPNVVPMIDVVESAKGLFLVMEYVHGESLSRLLRASRARGETIPPRLVATILHDALLGLDAAHETRGDDGALLDVVHRDVSPQNIIVRTDGVAQVLDFGVAKAAGRMQVTREGEIKGKLKYMAPEQLRGKADRRVDLFAAGVVLWETVLGRRFHEGMKDIEVVARITKGDFELPSKYNPELGPAFDRITMRALQVEPEQRYQTAREMAHDLEQQVGLVSRGEVAEWVGRLANDALQLRAGMVASMEDASRSLVAAEPMHPPSMTNEAMRGPSPSQMGYPMPPPMGPDPMAHRSGPFGPPNPMAHGGPGGADERRDLVPVVAFLVFFGVLLLTGIALGAWSLLVGRTRASELNASPDGPAVNDAPSSSVSAAPPTKPTTGRKR